MMRILAVSHNFNLEGASLSMFELMSALNDTGQIAISIMSLSEGPLEEKYQQQQMEILPLPVDALSLRKASTIDAVIEAFTSYITRFKPDIVYANTLLGYPVILAAKEAGVATAWNIRESQDKEFWLQYLGEYRFHLAVTAFEKASATFFVAHSTRALWQSLCKVNDAVVIHNALNRSNFALRRSPLSRSQWRSKYGIANDAVVYLNVGTLHERKGQMDLIQALNKLSIENVSAVAVCVGDAGGDYSKAVHDYCQQLPEPQQKNIVILPRQHDIADAYAAADVFVCCSRNESYPRIILEAMASRLAIITTPVFGIAEQVVFGKSALEYLPGDVDQLTQLMQYLCSNRFQLQQYAENAYDRLNELESFDDMIQQYRQVFSALVSSTKGDCSS